MKWSRTGEGGIPGGQLVAEQRSGVRGEFSMQAEAAVDLHRALVEADRARIHRCAPVTLVQDMGSAHLAQ
jgi:hypothetical protein